MNTLQLSLKKKWFEMTKAGVKTEDYRDINDYWCRRLLQCHKDLGTKKSKYQCKKANCCRCLTECNGGEFVNFSSNTMTLGYPKSTNTDRIIKFEHEGIEIREGNPEWGAEPGKLYFVIKHGKRIQ